jgi:predicted nucleotidyltransferase component of viral defense system
MKEELIAKAEEVADTTDRTNVARQYLQQQILASLSGSLAFRSLAFVGGTCLRFIRGLRRYSEDMDFSVETEKHYEPQRWMEDIRLALLQQGFTPSVSWKQRRAVDFGWVKIPRILHELGVAATEDQQLSIKLEADRNPPAGAHCVTTALAVPRLIAVRHHDLSSLMAGKLNAVLSRPYAKGRDWYDLLWYLAGRIEPNLELLGNGLRQNPSDFCTDARHWRGGVVDRLDSLDWAQVVQDVRPFLEDPSELAALTPATLQALLQGS